MEVSEFISKCCSFVTEHGELCIAAISLVISVISLFKSAKAEKLQYKINELELKIKQDEVEKLQKEREEEKNACVEARVVSVGNHKHHLKVWNSGKGTAYNVSAKFSDDANILIGDPEKQPFEELTSMKNYEMWLIIHSGSASKFQIITEWDDVDGEHHTRTQMGDR